MFEYLFLKQGSENLEIIFFAVNWNHFFNKATTKRNGVVFFVSRETSLTFLF